MAEKSLKKMSADEIKAEFLRLGRELNIIANTRNALDAELKQRESEVRITAKLGGYNQAERRALRDALNKDDSL